MTDTIFIAELAVTQVVKHPKNPRHKAVADDDMVASVRVSGIFEPLLVAPQNGSAKYILIAGHRRLDAAKKAKRTAVPVIVRADLVEEAQQLEAMIIENGHRVDLTPIEEAEGYAQLELLGYKPAAIAKAVGRDVKTVRSRLKLLQLAASTQRKVHAGDLTLDDASAFADFAGDPDATRRLEQASKGDSLRYQIQTERRRLKDEQAAAVVIAELTDLGAVELPLPDGKVGWWDVFNPKDGPVLLESTHSTDPADHDGCLAWINGHAGYGAGYATNPRAVCTQPARHADTVTDSLTEKQRQRAQEREEQQRLYEQHRAAEDAARTVRIESVTRLVEGVKVTKVLADLARATLPALVARMHTETYQQVLGIDPELQWVNTYAHDDVAKKLDHVADLAGASDAMAARALVAVLVAAGDDAFAGDAGNAGEPTLQAALTYQEFLTAIEHPFCDIDQELVERIGRHREAHHRHDKPTEAAS